jgi:hypothetical protein
VCLEECLPNPLLPTEEGESSSELQRGKGQSESDSGPSVSSAPREKSGREIDIT